MVISQVEKNNDQSAISLQFWVRQFANSNEKYCQRRGENIQTWRQKLI